ncbi:hypothetical protein LVJ94_30590 [Pendulispora rubella]|uniref:Uncharacterized protein n=1 Tax=Pendulispora rubella TaxID=2741070 RepID=A0ABZ2KT71_9BACT
MSKQLTKIGLAWFGTVGIGAVSVGVLVAACYNPPDKNTQTTTDQDVAAGKCAATPGGFPSPNCDNSDNLCEQTGCTTIPEATCGSTSTCMPLSNNTGKSTIDLRIRKLNVVAPPPLADNIIRSTVLNPNIDLNEPQCTEKGAGSFNWLFRVERTAGTDTGKLETGGAPPSPDPRGKGFCFYNHKAGDIQVNSAKADVTFTGDTFTSGAIEKLNVPIFLRGDVKNVIILPLSDVIIQNVTLSENNNCVGRFDLKALDESCGEDPSVCTKWKTAAALGGYITLEEADKVDVVDLTQSLCVLLTKADGGSDAKGIKRCPRDADNKLNLNDAQKGDYCSNPKGPGGCRDSFWLTATFAASAVTINDGAGVVECNP